MPIAEQPPFVPGQIVHLNSGSPPLTVHKVREDGYVEVEWFAGLEAKRDAFPAVSLYDPQMRGPPRRPEMRVRSADDWRA